MRFEPNSVMGALCITLALAAGDLRAQRFEKLAPYDAIRWNEGRPEVRVAAEWVGLIAIDGVEVESLVGFARQTWPNIWQKRFEEDLVEVLGRMGKPVKARVALRVRDLKTGSVREIPDVPMTAENRKAILLAAHARPASRPVPEAPGAITRKQAEEDCAALRSALVDGYSYVARRGVDLDAEIAKIRGKLGEPVDRRAFGVALMKLLALFGDGHTRVASDPSEFLPPGFAPFLAAEAEGRIVAFNPDRSGFLASDAPFLVSIDGVDAGRWIDAARAISAKGGPHFERRQAVRNLRFLAFLREELAVPARDEVEIVVESKDRRRTTVKLRVAERRPAYGSWPRAKTGELAGGFGYLRLESMDDGAEFLASLDQAIERFSKSPGLVLDVRGNGGGSREPLRRLLPHFMPAAGDPRVVNVAAARIGKDDDRHRPEGYLGNRFLYPAEWTGWSEPERKAIAAVARSFKPEWQPSGGPFSDWHYFVVSPRGEGRLAGKPAVVLMDGDCFSATDIFLGAFKGLDRVTLIGTTSGGGSGRARELRLAHSGISVQFSSMASYLPNGRLYDGNGVEPDVRCEPVATDHVGGTDTALDTALRQLKK